jgi:DNA primase
LDEQILVAELIKFRRNTIVRQNDASELMDLPVVKEQPQNVELIVNKGFQPKKINEDDEYELIRIMIKYGTYLINVEQIDDSGKKIETETSVIELIHHELDKDELAFASAVHEKIYGIFLEGLEQKTLYSSSYLIRLEDQEIVSFVTEIEADNHELSSKWMSNYNIATRTELDRLQETVMQAIYRFKALKVESFIQEIRNQLESNNDISQEELMDLLAQQMAYEKIKMIFAEKLGRTILR